MRTVSKILLVVFLISGIHSIAEENYVPGLAKPFPVRLADGSIIDVGNYGNASAGYRDMDGDGIPDLLVGELGNRGLRVYKNRGTATEPVFTAFSLLETTTGIALTDPG